MFPAKNFARTNLAGGRRDDGARDARSCTVAYFQGYTHTEYYAA